MSPKKVVKKPETMKVVRKSNGQYSKKTRKVELVSKKDFNDSFGSVAFTLNLLNERLEIETKTNDLILAKQAKLVNKAIISTKRLGVAVWTLLFFDVVATIAFVVFSKDILKFLGGL